METMDLKNYQEQIKACRLCQEEFGFEPRPIVWGTSQAKIVQIGQAPSIHVHEGGIPFQDASGKKLIHEWYQLTEEEFYNQDFIYMTMMAHCYPGKAKQGGDKKPPLRCARRWLDEELSMIENQCYLIVGSYAKNYFFPAQSLEECVFTTQELYGKPAYVIPHPSPLNNRWIKKHPEFAERMGEIRTCIHQLIHDER